MQTTVRRQLCLALQALARLTAPAALAITMSAPATAEPAAEARTLHRDKGAFPQINLADRATRGQRAVDQLGGRLPEVAAWYGKSADEFKAQLLHDRSWRLDHRGRVYIVEELARPLAARCSTIGGGRSDFGDLVAGGERPSGCTGGRDACVREAVRLRAASDPRVRRRPGRTHLVVEGMD